MTEIDLSIPPRIRIRLLGQISLWTPRGVVTRFRSNRVPALLGLLVTQRRTHQRLQVAQLLWPSTSAEVGLHNLRQTILYLRNSLAPQDAECLEVTRTTLRLLVGCVASDVDLLLSTEQFQTTHSQLLLNSEAVEVAQGQFLPGIDDEWIRDERSRLSQVYVRALLSTADSLMDDSPEKALQYAQRAVLEEPLMDGARVRKLRALVRTGEIAAAQLEYEAFAELLDQELGILPSDAVREALDGVSGKHRKSGAEDTPNVSTDIGFVMNSLALGDRPDHAVELALAVTPHWISVGTPRWGMEKLQEAVIRASASLSEVMKARTRVALAELNFAKGDLTGTERRLDELERERFGQTEELQFKILLLRTKTALLRLDGKSAIECAKAALAIARISRDTNLEIDALAQASSAALYCSEFSEALEYADHALVLAKRIGRTLSVASTLLAKAQALGEIGAVGESEECARMAIQSLFGMQVDKAIGIRIAASRLLENLGHLEEAEAGYRRGLTELESSDDCIREAITLTYLGDLVLASGRPREAVALQTKSLEIRRKSNHSLAVATSLRGLGKAYSDLDELNSAKQALLESANLFLNEDAIPGYASVLLALAVVEEKSNQKLLAARLARRSLKLLRGLTQFERKMSGRCGVTAIAEAERLLIRCTV